MKYLLNGLLVLLLFICAESCRKTSFIESPFALLSTSADTLHFDTVFTTTGSVTHFFKIFNLNDQSLRLSKVQLMGGTTSPFKMNLDGTSGTSFSNVEIAPNDSIYAFVTVTINPSAANLPFIVQDSIQIEYNGNTKFVQLEAFGQNANFLRNRRVTSDSSWNNSLPFVILGGLTVDSNVTLNIGKGCRVYAHADAPIIINGTLKVNGDTAERVTFQGDRLDPIYRDLPGSWPGIYFTRSSKDNVLNYAVIKNAFQGVVSQLPASNTNPKVTLNQCIIDNIYDIGILGLASSVNATNCLISNCGNNITVSAGGNYNFTHCTVVTYGNLYLSHKLPVLYLSDEISQTQSNNLSATFTNCIFYGDGGIVENEVLTKNIGAGTQFRVVMRNVLFKAKDNPGGITWVGDTLRNRNPQFDTINISRREFNFRLKETSPAINKGVVVPGVNVDLNGKPRVVNLLPDLGSYELQN